jgi:serine protease AprX
VRARLLAISSLLALGSGLFFGGLANTDEPVAAQEGPHLPDPTWRRLGLLESPTPESGRGVGIVLLDDTGFHPALRHLGGRLKHVAVDGDGNVSLVEPLQSNEQSAGKEEYPHGVEVLLQIASAPFRVRDRTYGGLAPGATYFVIPYLEVRQEGANGRHYRYDPRLDRAIEWVVENRQRWNIRIILLESGFDSTPPPPGGPAQYGLIKNTREYPIVRALERAIRAGILIVTGNGNTSTKNNLPPAEYLAVGAYHDSGQADPQFHRENLDEPWGRNSDGHVRPDVLAPKNFVPNHRTPEGGIAFFGGTSSASAQVAALCALLFARFPEADAPTVKYTLIRSGDPLPGSRRPGVRVNAARAIEMLRDGSVVPPWPRIPPPIVVTDPNTSLESKDAVERALALSALAWYPELFRAKDGERRRQVFWGSLRDDSPIVRKAAASALAGPESQEERQRLWDALRREQDPGVRGQLTVLLLDGAEADRLDDWVPLITDPNWTVRWCVGKILGRHYPDAPPIDYAFLPEEVEKKAEPILTWYRGRKSSR